MGSSSPEHNDDANVERVVTAVDGQTLTLKYKDGEKKIFVPANTPIVVYVQGTRAISSLAPKSSSPRSNSPMNVARSRVARRSGWSNAAYVTVQAVITTAANELVAYIHDRMPVILARVIMPAGLVNSLIRVT